MPEAFETRLPRGRTAPKLGRDQLDQRFGSEVDAEQLYTAKLLASELITNAVVHGTGGIILRGLLDEDRLRVEVIDDGKGFEHEMRRRDFDDVGGRGLAIVDSESSRWGVHEGTTHVWFELERPGPRLGEKAKPPE